MAAAAVDEPAGLEGVSAAFAREMWAAREADADLEAEAGDLGDLAPFFLFDRQRRVRTLSGISTCAAVYW